MSKHRWSGWPGAYCLKCFADDPMEYAIANDLFDVDTGRWVSPEAKAEFDAAEECPVADEVVA